MGKEVQKIHLTKLQFVDSAKFIVSSLSNVKFKHAKKHDNVIMPMIKYGHDNKKCKTCEIKKKKFWVYVENTKLNILYNISIL